MSGARRDGSRVTRVPRAIAMLALTAALAGAPLSGRATDDVCSGLSWIDVAPESGIDFVHDAGADGAKHLPETMGSGAAWIDHDGDGDLDLYVVQSGPFPPDGSPAAANRLYRNDAGRFREVEGAAGAGDTGYGQGVVAADADGDGDVDLYVCNFGRDTFLRNRGDGTFEDATDAAGLATGGWSSSAAFADADRDGDLDLYVARYVGYDPATAPTCADPDTGERRYCDPTTFPGAHDVYYRNEGDGRFVDATEDSGLAGSDGKGLGVVFTDLDGDRFPDLYVANDLTMNRLFRNRGSGAGAGAARFEDVSLFSGAAVDRRGKAEAGMGVAAGDVDGDLDPDLVVTNFDVETNTLYENRGGLAFEDVAAESGFGTPSFNLLGFGIALDDFDLDGDLDAYVANGHIYERPRREATSFRQRDLLLLGDGNGSFEEARCGPAFEAAEVGRGLAAGDYDDDGDVDLAVVNNRGPLWLLRNDLPRNDRWIGVSTAHSAPAAWIGARVELATDRGVRVRTVVAGDSYQSSSDPRVRFGLAEGETIESLSVDWGVGADLVVTYDVPEPGRYWVVEPRGGMRVAAAPDDPENEGSPLPIGWLAAGGVAVIALVLWWRRRA